MNRTGISLGGYHVTASSRGVSVNGRIPGTPLSATVAVGLGEPTPGTPGDPAASPAAPAWLEDPATLLECEAVIVRGLPYNELRARHPALPWAVPYPWVGLLLAAGGLIAPFMPTDEGGPKGAGEILGFLLVALLALAYGLFGTRWNRQLETDAREGLALELDAAAEAARQAAMDDRATADRLSVTFEQAGTLDHALSADTDGRLSLAPGERALLVAPSATRAERSGEGFLAREDGLFSITSRRVLFRSPNRNLALDLHRLVNAEVHHNTIMELWFDGREDEPALYLPERAHEAAALIRCGALAAQATRTTG